MEIAPAGYHQFGMSTEHFHGPILRLTFSALPLIALAAGANVKRATGLTIALTTRKSCLQPLLPIS